MAAIDKIYTNRYWYFDKFRLWCLIHKPTLLLSFCDVFGYTYNTWENAQKSKYDEQMGWLSMYFAKYPTINKFIKEHQDDIDAGLYTIESLTEDYEWNIDKFNELKYTIYEYIELPITCFSFKQDRWLFWHCPLDFVREYLIEQCGYKERWYHKFLFKFTMYKD